MVAVEQQIEYYDGGTSYYSHQSTAIINGESFIIGTVGIATEILLTKIRLFGRRFANPGNISAKLYYADGNQRPTGPILDSCTKISATIPTVGINNIDLLFKYDRLLPNISYVFAIQVAAPCTIDNHIKLIHSTSQGYPGGKRVYYNGTLWFTYSQNFNFAVFGYPKNTIGMTTTSNLTFK